FYFDEIYAGAVCIDTLAPELLSVAYHSSNSLKLQFSENVDSVSSHNPTSFYVDHQVGNPVQVEQDTDDPLCYYIYFSEVFLPDISYTLTVSDILDLSGNTMAVTQLSFGFHEGFRRLGARFPE
ncbi:MAG: Ig-like domain-containing protein, partial [Syntrophobacteraceae bacterium]|nr:Ig-like domain-containing protein [Syntrophobacteraceae bacterium]